MTSRHIIKISPVIGFTILMAGLYGSLWPDTTLGQEVKEETELDTRFYYTIKKGDTLWDLSQRFFDSPWIWPDMWEKNKEMPNPHWIYPGNKIRVYSREGWERLKLDKDRSEMASLVDEEITEERFYNYTPINSIGFVKKEPIRPLGYIFKVKEDRKEIVGEGDVVSLHPSAGTTFEVGKRYALYRVLETFKDKTSRPHTLIGTQHLIVGLADVVEVHEGIATAIIHQSFRNIEADDLVKPYQPRSSQIKITGSTDGIRGTIFALEESVHFFGDGAIVFVDKGQEHGIQVGQFYEMFTEDEKAVVSGHQQRVVSLAPVVSGDLLILHVEESASTALVTSIHDVIEPGIQFRTP